MRTPLASYQLDLIASACRLMSDRVAAPRQWKPELSGKLPLEVLQTVKKRTSAGSCRCVSDLDVLHDAGFREILISRPVVDRASLSQAAGAARSCRLQFVVDHFRHAELLSQQLRFQDAQAGVLIQVESGFLPIGVRPGPDSVRLAKAVAHLPGLQVDGVFIDDVCCQEANESKVDLKELLTIAYHSRRLIQAAGVKCCEVVTGRIVPEVLGASEVSTCLLSPLIRLGNEHSESMTSQRHLLPVVLKCQVLSRPTLETCVIDCGANSIRLPDTTVLDPTGAELVKLLDDVALLKLSGPALDVRIGDIITLRVWWSSCVKHHSEVRTEKS